MGCPICGKEARPRAENPSAPFCSSRCKVIDLGKWLNEGYRVPTDEPADGASEGPPAPKPDHDDKEEQ